MNRTTAWFAWGLLARGVVVGTIFTVHGITRLWTFVALCSLSLIALSGYMLQQGWV